MGLDNFWVDPQGNPGVIEEGFKVCGGMFSGNGDSSFRGKVYHEYVKDVTGVSLYDDVIDNDCVMEMANDLRNSLDEFDEGVADEYGLDKEEVENLVMMFEEHGNAGHHLESWW